METLAALCTTLAILMACWPFYRAKSRQNALLRARRPGGAWRKEPTWFESMAQYLGLTEVDKLCQHAGRPYGLTGVALLQWQFLAALLFLVLFSAVNVAFGVLVGVVTWFMPRILLSSMAQQRRMQIALELPAFLDLWGLLVASGEGVETALVEICKRHPEWLLSTEMRRVLDRISASGLFGESLVEEAKVTGALEFVTVAEQVSHLADGGGVPSRELSRMAEQIRQQRVSDLMQAAGAMAVVGIFPKLGAIFLSLMPVLATIVLTVKSQM